MAKAGTFSSPGPPVENLPLGIRGGKDGSARCKLESRWEKGLGTASVSAGATECRNSRNADVYLGIFSDPVAMRYYPGTKNRQETED